MRITNSVCVFYLAGIPLSTQSLGNTVISSYSVLTRWFPFRTVVSVFSQFHVCGLREEPLSVSQQHFTNGFTHRGAQPQSLIVTKDNQTMFSPCVFHGSTRKSYHRFKGDRSPLPIPDITPRCDVEFICEIMVFFEEFPIGPFVFLGYLVDFQFYLWSNKFQLSRPSSTVSERLAYV